MFKGGQLIHGGGISPALSHGGAVIQGGNINEI